MNHYCDMWFWRASDQEAVARHLRDRTTSVPDTLRRASLLRESCDCGGEEEFQYREAVLDEGEWVLRCPECGHLDRLYWLSEDARSLVLGLARRRWRVQIRRS